MDRIEADIQREYPEYPVFHAWTSRFIRRKFLQKNGIRIPSVKDVLQELLNRGIYEVAVQPTHVLYGSEYENMTNDIRSFEKYFSRIVIGSLVLSSNEDKKRVIQVIGEEIRPKSREVLTLMGHGASCGGDAVFGELNRMFRELGYENIFLGAMEGQPDFQSVLEDVRMWNPERILLAPFMITAGKHAEIELSGEKDTSWKSRFEAAGFSAECILKGLGEYEGIRRIFLEHVEVSMRILKGMKLEQVSENWKRSLVFAEDYIGKQRKIDRRCKEL